MLRRQIPAPMLRVLMRLVFPVRARLSRHHIQIGPEGVEALEASIKRNYHRGWRGETSYSREMYQVDLHAHLFGRLELDRRMVVPWLDRARPLRHMRVLEIGCGTGSSTIALAEQGANVTGIDIDEDSLAVARDRCRIYGVEAEWRTLNAGALVSTFGVGAFDTIIFFASLEHMTIAERLAALRDAWSMLPEKGQLVVVETPNRLWFYDGHTSRLPFFHWLPDELAFRYSAFSKRENFRELYRELDPASLVHFLRRGRGMSFHEFDLAIKPSRDLKIVSSLSSFAGMRYKLQRSMLEHRYKAMLRRIYPGLHEGFYEDNLFLVIERD